MKIIKKDKCKGGKEFTTISKTVKVLEEGGYYKKGIVEKLLKQGHQLHAKTCSYKLVLNMRDFDTLS